MRDAFKFLPVIRRIANSKGIDHTVTGIGQNRIADLPFAIGGNLFRKLFAFGRSVNADCIDANLPFAFREGT